MLDGDGFGDAAFSGTDSYALSIQGYDVNGRPTMPNPVVFDLGSGTSIVNTWSNVDLSGLNNDVKSLQFTVTSTQPYTPGYFALGSLTVVPEPSTLALVACGGFAAFVMARSNRRRRPLTAGRRNGIHRLAAGPREHRRTGENTFCIGATICGRNLQISVELSRSSNFW